MPGCEWCHRPVCPLLDASCTASGMCQCERDLEAFLRVVCMCYLLAGLHIFDHVDLVCSYGIILSVCCPRLWTNWCIFLYNITSLNDTRKLLNHYSKYYANNLAQNDGAQLGLKISWSCEFGEKSIKTYSGVCFMILVKASYYLATWR